MHSARRSGRQEQQTESASQDERNRCYRDEHADALRVGAQWHASPGNSSIVLVNLWRGSGFMAGANGSRMCVGEV